MHIDEETCEWLDLPSPLEMYKHHAALLEDEIAVLHLQLRKARDNVRGLVQMNDELATGKAIAEAALKKALADAGRLNQETSEMGRRINASIPPAKATYCSASLPPQTDTGSALTLSSLKVSLML